MILRQARIFVSIGLILITGSAIAQTKTVKPPTIPCVDAVTGAVKIKNKCNTRAGEYVLNVAQLLSATQDAAQGPRGPGFDVTNCKTRFGYFEQNNPDIDVYESRKDCEAGEFMLTHGISNSPNVVVQSIDFNLDPAGRYPTGVVYFTGKKQSQYSYTWRGGIGVVCCPVQ